MGGDGERSLGAADAVHRVAGDQVAEEAVVAGDVGGAEVAGLGAARDVSPPVGDVDWSLVMRNAPKLENGMCEPSDVAAMFAYLASEDARKVTGSLFTIDGGQLAG